MRIKLWVKDLDTGDVLEEMGECLTDSPVRAIQIYHNDEAWIDKGYNADIAWKDITYVSVTVAAQRHDLSVAWVRKLATGRRIPGAVKAGARAWLIPTGWVPPKLSRGAPRKIAANDQLGGR